MIKRAIFIAVITQLSGAFAHAEVTFPRLFKAHYSVSSNGREMGTMTRTLTVDGARQFVFKSELEATNGLYALLGVKVVETSRWRLNGDAVMPLDYHYKQTGLNMRVSSAQFDWQRNVIGVVHKNKTSSLPAESGMLDRLLYQLVLMRDLEQRRESIEYTVVDGTKVRHYPIERLGEETITTPLGDLETVKVRYRRPGSERSTTLWCAKTLHYLPVKLDHFEKDGERTSALITSVSGL